MPRTRKKLTKRNKRKTKNRKKTELEKYKKVEVFYHIWQICLEDNDHR